MSALQTFSPAGQPTYTETGRMYEHPACGVAYTNLTRLDDQRAHVFTCGGTTAATTVVIATDEDGDPLWAQRGAGRLIVHRGLSARDGQAVMDAAHEGVVARVRLGEIVPGNGWVGCAP